MIIYPGANWRPVPCNYSAQRRPTNLGLVVHCQVGEGSLFGWFSDPSAGVSAHLWVGKSGAVEQYVDLDQTAWAQVDGNASYVSVETEGEVDEALTYAQQGSLAALLAWGHLPGIYAWPLALVDHGGHGVTTHAHYPSGTPDPAWGGHACPGQLRSLQLAKIVEAARFIAQPV